MVDLARKFSPFQMPSSCVSLIARAIRKKPRCKLLVFGIGHDSLLWTRINRRGRSVFIEDKTDWYRHVTNRHPQIEAYLIDYGTSRSQWKELLSHPAQLGLTLPRSVVEETWDVIVVDGPKGNKDSDPGRMKSIYWAAELANRPGKVFVDDSSREVEDAYASRYLGSGVVVAGSRDMKQFTLSR